MATRTWQGSISASWSVPGNWLEGEVPIIVDDVVFPAGAPAVDIDVDVVVRSITFDDSYLDTVTLGAGARSIDVADNLVLGGVLAELAQSTWTVGVDFQLRRAALAQSAWTLIVGGVGTVLAGVYIENCDASGSASPISALGATDGGGNVNITFSPEPACQRVRCQAARRRVTVRSTR